MTCLMLKEVNLVLDFRHDVLYACRLLRPSTGPMSSKLPTIASRSSLRTGEQTSFMHVLFQFCLMSTLYALV